jgi:hypothetical protein
LILLADLTVEFGIFACQFALGIRQFTVETGQSLHNTGVGGQITACTAD